MNPGYDRPAPASVPGSDSGGRPGGFPGRLGCAVLALQLSTSDLDNVPQAGSL